jgi:lysine-N-methylase
MYPLALADDGVTVRVTPAIECACVVESAIASAEDGDELLPGVRTSDEIDPRLVVDELPDEIGLTNDRSAPRSELRAWSDALRGVECEDVAAAFLALARLVGERGLDVDAALAAVKTARSIDAAGVSTRIGELGERAARREREDFRSPRDLARQTFALIEVACSIAGADLDALAAPKGSTAAAERFYFDTVLFGHHLVVRSGGQHLADALVDRAARVLVGRAMVVAVAMAEMKDPALRHPLAILEGTIRGYGL